MLEFKKVTLEDREILAEYLSKTPHRACDYCVGNLVLWADLFNTRYTVARDMLFIEFSGKGTSFFSYPCGGGDLKAAFELLFSYCEENGRPFHMSLVEPHMFEEIERAYPGEFDIAYIRDNADYVYTVEALRELSGKKYHGKKNHINKFLKTYTDWSYERISDENTDECIEMVKEWCIKNKCLDEKQKSDEIGVVANGLRHRKELNLLGGIIRAGGKIAAMTLGEKCSDDMFVIHFEKAFSDILGAYPMINQQFIINELSGFTYVNREEDLGVEGLRRAKESYYPAFMAEKGVIKRKNRLKAEQSI